jgi:UDP-N-acetylmuramoylalanine--D-glutamate ligase
MWTSKRVVILGMARQGMALARYLCTRGAHVTLSDMKPASELSLELSLLEGLPIAYVLGNHPASLLERCDVLCLSGGVPIDLPIVLQARRAGVPLSNDAQIFVDACPAPIIGITGSAGKTTTTTLVGEMLASEYANPQRGVHVWVGGNIGNPLIADVERIQPTDRVVMELSSFQLELMTRSPHIACITNITPNHLDRHATMEAYIAAKQHIVDHQSTEDWVVLSADNDVTATLPARARRVWFSLQPTPAGGAEWRDAAWLDTAGNLRVRIAALGLDEVICQRRDLLLMGDHNVLNVLAASALSALGGASLASIRALAATFRGVAHRLQLVREMKGVRYYDDSIATAPERLMAALRCFTQPVVLLCGGRDKHLPWAEVVQVMAQHCRHVVLFGEMAGMVNAEIERQQTTFGATGVTVTTTLEDAVAVAAAKAKPGDVVLLSPGGTSYDAFKDFAERGGRFVQLVQAIGDEV